MNNLKILYFIFVLGIFINPCQAWADWEINSSEFYSCIDQMGEFSDTVFLAGDSAIESFCEENPGRAFEELALIEIEPGMIEPVPLPAVCECCETGTYRWEYEVDNAGARTGKTRKKCLDLEEPRDRLNEEIHMIAG